MKKEDFNGYSFDKEKMRKAMKYIVITRGDLDLNGAYAYRNKSDLKKGIEGTYRKIEAVFEVKDITQLV